MTVDSLIDKTTRNSDIHSRLGSRGGRAFGRRLSSKWILFLWVMMSFAGRLAQSSPGSDFDAAFAPPAAPPAAMPVTVPQIQAPIDVALPGPPVCVSEVPMPSPAPAIADLQIVPPVPPPPLDGGQPGFIEVSGGIDVHDPRLKVVAMAGRNSEGGTTPVDVPVLITDREMSLSDRALLDSRTIPPSSYFNWGCDLTAKDTAGLSSIRISPKSVEGLAHNRVIVADRIFLCASMDSLKFVLLYANTIHLREFHQQSTGSIETTFRLVAHDLVLEGANEILSDAGGAGALRGPTIAISADSLQGSGTLLLRTIGVNATSISPLVRESSTGKGRPWLTHFAWIGTNPDVLPPMPRVPKSE